MSKLFEGLLRDPRAAACFLSLLFLGCGYSQGFRATRLGVQTVSIHTVSNLSYRQDVDADLTRQLGKDLTQMTGLLPGTPRTADAVLKVELSEVLGRAITRGGEGSIREGSVVLLCEAKLVDRKTGAVLSRSRHADQGEFRVVVGEDRAKAYREAVQDLSRKILIAIGRRTKSKARSDGRVRPDDRRAEKPGLPWKQG